MLRVQQFMDENRKLARAQQWVELQVEAESMPTSTLLAGSDLRIQGDLAGFSKSGSNLAEPRGIRSIWRSGPSGLPPELVVRSNLDDKNRLRLAISCVLAIVVLVAGVLLLQPRILARVLFFWPELIIVLGIAGWHFHEPDMVYGAFILLGLVARCQQILVWTGGLMLRLALVRDPIQSA